MAGFIKIYRDVLDSVLFTKPILLQMWLLLNKLARFTKTEQDGIEILPGQVLTSAAELSQRCNLPERRVRYILDCLEKMELITRENVRNRYTIITLTNPDELKCIKQTELPPPTEVTAEMPPEQPKTEPKICSGLFANVYLTNDEIQQLQKRSRVAKSYIDRLSAYKRRTNKNYEDDFAVLCEWISKDEISKSENPQTTAPIPAKPSSPKPSQPKPSPPKTSLSHYAGTNTDFFTAPASYDIEKAEEYARNHVPKLLKRNTGRTKTEGN